MNLSSIIDALKFGYHHRSVFERSIQRSINHSSYLALINTNEYVRALHMCVDYKELSLSERERIATYYAEESRYLWDNIYFSIALDDAEERFRGEGLPYSKIEEYARDRAEIMMVQDLYIPPHFTKEHYCRDCGNVQVPENRSFDHIACPWCVVGVFKSFNKEII